MKTIIIFFSLITVLSSCNQDRHQQYDRFNLHVVRDLKTGKYLLLKHRFGTSYQVFDMEMSDSLTIARH